MSVYIFKVYYSERCIAMNPPQNTCSVFKPTWPITCHFLKHFPKSSSASLVVPSRLPQCPKLIQCIYLSEGHCDFRENLEATQFHVRRRRAHVRNLLVVPASTFFPLPVFLITFHKASRKKDWQNGFRKWQKQWGVFEERRGDHGGD